MKRQLSVIIRELADSHRAELGVETVAEMAVPSYTEGYFFSRYVFWRKLDWVVRFAAAENEMAILDYGCGTGILLPVWSANAAQVFASDLHLELARKLTSRLSLSNVAFVSPEEVADTIPDSTLDIIVAANVLEHVEDRRPLLKAFRTKLKDHGRLIVSGPTEGTLYKIGRRIVGFSGDYHVTNVAGVVADVLDSGFRMRKRRRWPIPGPGCLYHILEFSVQR